MQRELEILYGNSAKKPGEDNTPVERNLERYMDDQEEGNSRGKKLPEFVRDFYKSNVELREVHDQW